MADIIDMAHEREELLREAALENRKPGAGAPNGRCFNCDEPLTDGHRFCDADCRDDWEKRNG